MRIILYTAVILLAGQHAMANRPAAPGVGYQHNDAPFNDPTYIEQRRGWFHYEEIVLHPSPTPEKPVAPEPEPEPERRPEPEPERRPEPPAEPPKHPVFSVAWLRDNIPIYLDAAIDNPTRENIQAYLFVQQMALDKSQRFAQEAVQISTGDPMHDNLFQVNYNAALRRQQRLVANRTSTNIAMRELSQTVGLILFIDEGCKNLCERQFHTMRHLFTENRSEGRFELLIVSIDGTTTQQVGIETEGYRAHFIVSPELARQARVIGTPTTAMFYNNVPYSIANGFTAFSDIESRLKRVANREGALSDDLYYADTRVGMNDFATESLSMELAENLNDLGTGETNFIPPDIMKKTLELLGQ